MFIRKNPIKHTRLIPCSIENIGATRMKLLRFMLEHPGFPICIETLDRVYDNSFFMERNSLAASIRCLRNRIQEGDRKGPYIITDRTYGESVSATGSVYIANPQWKYLVVRALPI